MHNGEASARQGDTNDEVTKRQVALYRAMSTTERLEIAFSLSSSMRELSLTGLQRLHPADDDLKLRVRLATLLYGDAAGSRVEAALARRAL